MTYAGGAQLTTTFLGFLGATLGLAADRPVSTPSPSPVVSPAALSFEKEGVLSQYTPILFNVWKSWPPKDLDHWGDGQPLATVKLRCFETPGNEFYIGVGQSMVVQAPLEKVAAVVENFAEYVGLFNDLVKTEVRRHEANQLVVFFEQSIPVPFVPNDRSEMIYRFESGTQGRKAYRYQLKNGGNLKFNDGIIVLEPMGPGQTAYTEIDFYDADWGIAKSFGKKKIWRNSLESLYQTDLAIKLRSEHPDWEKKRILKESRREASDQNFKPLVEAMKPWPIN